MSLRKLGWCACLFVWPVLLAAAEKDDEPEARLAALANPPRQVIQLPEPLVRASPPFDKATVAWLDNERIIVGDSLTDRLWIQGVSMPDVEPESIAVEGRVIGRFRVSADRRFLAAEVSPIAVIGRPVRDGASVMVWDLASHDVIATFPITGVFKAYNDTWLDISADGAVVAFAGTEQSIQVWDVASNKKIAELATEEPLWGDIHNVRLSPDGLMLAALWRNDVVFWKWRDGDKFDRVPTGRSNYSLEFSPDNQRVATGPDTRRTIEFRDLESFGVVKSLSISKPGFLVSASVRNLSFVDEGKSLIAEVYYQRGAERTDSTSLFCWDAATGKVRNEIILDGLLVKSFEASPDGSALAVVIQPGDKGVPILALWDFRSLKTPMTGEVERE